MKKNWMLVLMLLLLLSLALFSSCQSDPINEKESLSESTESIQETETEAPLEGTEGLRYTLLEDGTYSVSYGIASRQAVIVIPATYNNKPVSEIASGGFKGLYALKRVVIADGVKTIKISAFEGCNHLKSIVIPESVSVIGQYAFRYCSSLESVEIPKNVKTLWGATFEDCRALTTVKLHEGLEEIKSSDFAGCTLLVNIELPSTLKTIGGYAFAECTALESIEIPHKVKILQEGCFEDCTSLESVTFADNSQLKFIEKRAFSMAGIKKLEIPATLELTGPNAFWSVYPQEVYFTDIAAWCNVLRGDEAPLLANATIYVNGVETTDIVIPDGVTSFSRYTFGKCKTIRSITIPESVKIIPDRAFEGCTGLTKVTIFGCVSEIGMSAFLRCDNLSEVAIVLPNTSTNIGAFAFSSYTKLIVIYYNGSESDWENIQKADGNSQLDVFDTVYYYSESQPTDSNGKYWHYVNGVPTAW